MFSGNSPWQNWQAWWKSPKGSDKGDGHAVGNAWTAALPWSPNWSISLHRLAARTSRTFSHVQRHNSGCWTTVKEGIFCFGSQDLWILAYCSLPVSVLSRSTLHSDPCLCASMRLYFKLYWGNLTLRSLCTRTSRAKIQLILHGSYARLEARTVFLLGHPPPQFTLISVVKGSMSW